MCKAIIANGEHRAAKSLTELIQIIQLKTTQPSDYPAELGETSEDNYEAAIEGLKFHVSVARKKGFLRD